ncbi:glycosyl hydrolase [Terriglobus saanensis]|uniref:Glycoside hydrolase family 2 sugar binding protein n=1 Tax=Terriglobus saanensis (strain ATCC BAA-1853 / DSM 23119 / SP1PR4) TaxID=401053 RepID=E8UX70_TERSS|nr:glycosyl hydrolase [Terriglobus saanensis]ADV83033.1 glycoside hydrolase family 2 sugar binding protein [Terriglobus saanensis SP1PR4]
MGLSAMGIGGLLTSRGWALQITPTSSPSSNDALYSAFLDPDRQFSIRPFWFWNGALEVGELRRQMKQMIDHGVYGAYAHNRDGLETPYLSETWWKVVGEALDAAQELGFSLCMVNEFEWPSGEARDYWLPGPQKSRVVQANPAFHMKRLRQVETTLRGPQTAHLTLAQNTAHIVIAKSFGPGQLDAATLKVIEIKTDAKELTWEVPEGDWIVFSYVLEDTIGPDHGSVDIMSREAVAEYIKIYYEEFYKRHGKHFGKALPVTFADHEGTYGGRLPWTPRLFESFKAKVGYELVPLLPALTYDIGLQTEKVRCDLLDTVSELYSSNFWQQITDWCEQHKLEHTGHVWEESLFFGPAYQGDFFRILRSMTNPGCDTLDEWGRQSIWLKENASVADFERKRVVCENQGVQGEGSYLSPERMRRVSNGLAAWNVSEFIPHAFDYDLAKTNYPPDWFRSEPYLRWFKSYADQMRRVSFMNRNSHELAEIVLLYPQVSVWGQSSTSFKSDKFSYILHDANWSTDARETNDRYAELKLLLSRERLAYQVADDEYLVKGKIDGASLTIADSHFKVIVLPPMSTIRRSTAQQIARFIDAGGIVFALGYLPYISVESGRNDPALLDLWKSRFDTLSGGLQPKPQTSGRAYVVDGSETDLLDFLKHHVRPDALIVDGPVESLFTLRKKKDGSEFFWLVNDSPMPRVNLLKLPAHGRPERWDAETGLRVPLFYESTPDGTIIRLKLDAWDAAYIVFDLAGASQTLRLETTNLDDFHIVKEDSSGVTVRVTSLLPATGGRLALTKDEKRYHGSLPSPSTAFQAIEGSWEVTVGAPVIEAPYALSVEDPNNLGSDAAWYAKTRVELDWRELWLSPMRYSLQSWNVIGPFPNPDDLALDQSYPPEHEIDFDKSYIGDHGVRLKWLQAHAERYSVEQVSGFGEIGLIKLTGGPNGNDSYIVDYAAPLGISPLDGTFYAQTFVYLPQTTKCRLLLATGSPRAVFVNGHQVYSRWLRPLYNSLDDAFAAKVDVDLKEGWNSILVKLLHNPANEVGGRFFCRVETEEGRVIPGQRCSTRTYQPESKWLSESYLWLRFEVPPLVSALNLPPFKQSYQAYIDGKSAEATQKIPLSAEAKQVTLRIDSREILDVPFTFTTVASEIPLGSWMRPGLRNFSGEMTYEKNVQISADLLKEGLLLDCGEVGVVAEAWLNGEYLGSRSWAPFVFNLSRRARAGVNQFKVKVANTEGNARAVGASRRHLDNIDISGWHGPARLVPFADRELHLTS